ncbi:YheC/YheD family endospore coat-associated protein [Paenibacillus koleovorans]|uniref:YheC/YheD family endospore coat-associated protein n=1 Tax=Paenibacillus koleovorans TaxID=121608 RepID=UPI000FD8AED1|nr:YheC/YheD family protein [Paenibacillus koleovorans]
MSKLTLGVMTLYLNANKQLEERAYFRKLIAQGKRLGITVVVFTPQDVDYSYDRVQAQLYDPDNKVWVRRWMPLPQVIYDRCRYQPNERFRQFQKFRARYADRLVFLNRPIGNKWSIHQLLSRNTAVRPYMPATSVYHSAQDLVQFIRGRNLVYMKPINGTGGRGIVRIEKVSSGTYLIQGRDSHRRIITPRTASERQIPQKLTGFNIRDRYLIQQGIQSKLSDGRVHDFRLLIQKNGSGQWEVTGCAGRVGPKRSITSNLHGGGEAVPMLTLLRLNFSNDKTDQIVKEIHRLSHSVAEQLERTYGKLCELGLDIAIDPSGHPWLLELNPKPAREVFIRIGERDTYAKAISRPLEYALWVHAGGNRSRKAGSGSGDKSKPLGGAERSGKPASTSERERAEEAVAGSGGSNGSGVANGYGSAGGSGS